VNKLTFKLTGTAPLLMHSDVGIDQTHPLTKASKKLTGKRNKTEEDHIALLYLDWQLGLYHDEKDGPIIPSANIERCLTDSAKMRRLGTHFKRGLRIPSPHSKLEYMGPRTKKELLSDKHWPNYRNIKPMKVGTSKVPRCRPMFTDWWLTTDVFYDDVILDTDQVIEVCESAGRYIGLCDSRPKFGSFSVEVID